MKPGTPLIAAAAAFVGFLWTAPISATPQLLTDAKKQGLPAQNCQYCHVSQMPQKGTFKPDDLNERGKWLLTSKSEHQAKNVQADWLKQYPGGAEQK
jgi:hypothetical protein